MPGDVRAVLDCVHRPRGSAHVSQCPARKDKVRDGLIDADLTYLRPDTPVDREEMSPPERNYVTIFAFRGHESVLSSVNRR